MTMNTDARIYVAGHRGLVGSAIVRRLQALGFKNLVTRTHAELDLTDQGAVDTFFGEEAIDYVFLAAAKVGGIHANDTYPAEFIRDNLAIQTNVIHAAYRAGVGKLVFLGSSCIYPKHAPQPMPEDCLLTGPLEPTNEPYAIAKIAGLKMCAAYRRQYGFDAVSVMPTNLFGPGDNFHPENSHVIPALVRRFHEAKEAGADRVTIWGTGAPLREFLYVDDMADATIFAMQHYADEMPLNIGSGAEVSIKELATLVRDTVGFRGELAFDPSKPDGTPRKLLDTARLAALGWTAQVSLKEGLQRTYDWYCNR